MAADSRPARSPRGAAVPHPPVRSRLLREVLPQRLPTGETVLEAIVRATVRWDAEQAAQSDERLSAPAEAAGSHTVSNGSTT